MTDHLREAHDPAATPTAPTAALTVQQIAAVAHAANRAYQEVTGEPWPDQEWSAHSRKVQAVRDVLNSRSGVTAEEQHEQWLVQRTAAGYTYGPVKRPDRLEDPCMVPYADLPDSEKIKDALYGAVVGALTRPSTA